MKPRGHAAERARYLALAKDALIDAAHILVGPVGDSELGAAIVVTGVALRRLAQADVGERARAFAEALVRDLQRQRQDDAAGDAEDDAEAPPGPRRHPGPRRE